MLINRYTWEYISVQTLYHALSLRGVPSCELRDRACLAGLAPEVRRTHAIYRSNPVLPRLPAGLYVYRRRAGILRKPGTDQCPEPLPGVPRRTQAVQSRAEGFLWWRGRQASRLRIPPHLHPHRHAMPAGVAAPYPTT